MLKSLIRLFICFFLVVFHSDVVVGAVCARRETLNGETCVYIMTLSVLKAYRNRGLGSKMLQLVIDQCKTWGDIAYIYLHVQVSNLVALKFYQQKFGFEITETLENYYKRIEPAECHILKLKIAK